MSRYKKQQMNDKLVLVIGEDRNEITSLLKLMQGQNFYYQVYGEAIILNYKKKSQNNKQQIIYIPYINTNDTEFLDIVYYLQQKCDLVSIMCCLNYSTQVNKEIQSIVQKLQTDFKQKEIAQNTKFFIYNSLSFCKFEQNIKQIQYNLKIPNNDQHQYFTKLGENLFQNYNYIQLKHEWNSEQIQTFFKNQELFDSYIQQFIQKDYVLNEKLFLEQLENSNIYSLFGFNQESIKQIYSNLISITQFKKQIFYAKSTNIFSCDTCQIIYIQDCQQTMILSQNDFLIKHLQSWNKKCSCGQSTYYMQMDHQKIYDLFKYLLLFEYEKYILQGINNLEEQQKQLTNGILLLRNESYGQMSIIQRVYTDIIEQENEIIAGDDVDDLFYLISTPDFIFESDTDEKMEEFSNLFNQKEIYFIIFCLNYQRTDLMKKQLYEMLKLLNQVNRIQMGVFIIQTNSNQIIDQKLFEQFSGQIQNVDAIFESDLREQIIQKVKKMINQNFSQTLDFSNTIFNQQIENCDKISIQLNERVEQLEQQQIKALCQTIDIKKEESEKLQKNLQQLKSQMDELQKEIETAEKKLQDSNQIISINEQKLKELQQYKQKKKHYLTQNVLNKKKK